MRGRDHIAIGAGSAALVLGAIQSASGGLDFSALAPSFFAAAAGSLGPDLDHPGSLASMSIPITLITYGGVFLAVRGWESSHARGIPLGLSSFGPESVVWAWAAIGIGIALLALSMFLGAAFGHRGIVHSVAFGAGASVLVAIGLAVFGAPMSLALPFAWGWLAHLLADSTTKAGLGYFLWPLAQRS